MDGDCSYTREGEETRSEGKATHTIQECPRWHSIRAPHGMPVECTPKGVWIRVDGSSRIPEVGRRGRLREDGSDSSRGTTTSGESGCRFQTWWYPTPRPYLIEISRK